MIIVTGANGFIGQRVVALLIKKYPKKRIVCCVGPSRKKHEIDGINLLKKMPVQIVDIDILQKRSLNKLPKSPELVIHLAAAVDTSKSDFSANDIGTNNLIGALSKMNSKTHFIYTSTGAIWGGRKNSRPIVESTPVLANNDYGRTKLRGEELLINQSRKMGFRLTILRLNTVFGADPREDKLFGMMSKYVKKQSLISRLNWPGKFGVVHVDDVAKSIVECSKKSQSEKNPEIYIASTENVTLPFICHQMYRQLGIKYRPVILPNWFWKFAAFSRYLTVGTEKILPSVIYNLIWRGTLITNDIFKADGKKLIKALPKWKRKKLKDRIKEVLI